MPAAAHAAALAAAATLRRGPRKAAEGLAYYNRSVELAEATLEAATAIAGEHPDNTDLAARAAIAERSLADTVRRRDALAAAIRSARLCLDCGAPLADTSQPGYADSVGPECWRKRKATP